MKKGFTLIETLIYIAIIGMIVSSFVIFVLSISASRTKTYAVQEVQANSRFALDLLSQRIKSAQGIISPTPGNSASILILDMADADLTFNVTAGVLSATEGLADSIPITSSEVDVSSLIFTNLTAAEERENIRIEMTVNYQENNSKEYDYSQSFQTAVSLRR
ncbi:MAG: prepilin-type N-terminal cleavage/methylation domain-containing protein [bacterium]